MEILAYRAKGHSPVLNPDMTVRAGADLESTYGVRSFSELDQALAERPAAVFVTGPNTTHLPIAIAAAKAGCHLFIEKPLSDSAESLDRLVDLVEQKGLVAMVAYQFRFHPGLVMLKSLIEGGKLGRILAAHIVNGEYLPDWHPYEDYREAHPARRELGGGSLSIQTHELDYAVWLFGMPKRLFSVGGQLSRLEVDVEDSVSVLLECSRDGRPLPVHVHLDYLQRPPQRLCEVVGDAGKARYDYYANQIEFHDTFARTVEIHRFEGFDRNQMFIDELNHFFACVRGEAKPIVGLREAERSLQVALAAKESLRTGSSVEMTHA
jgi:predicted dehydrogenase